MIESIKTALASWLRTEVFALVGEAMQGHDEDRADMLTEIEALKGEVAALREQVAERQEESAGPSAQQVADCISTDDLRKALRNVDLSYEVKEAVSDHIDNMDLSADLGEAVENAIGNSALPQDQINDAVTMCAASIAEAIVEDRDFMGAVVAAIGKKLVG